jgi:hypothetical protein
MKRGPSPDEYADMEARHEDLARRLADEVSWEIHHDPRAVALRQNVFRKVRKLFEGWDWDTLERIAREMKVDPVRPGKDDA